MTDADKRWLKDNVGPVAMPVLYIMVFLILMMVFLILMQGCGSRCDCKCEAPEKETPQTEMAL